MNPLEFRKIIQVGFRFEQPPEAKPVLLGADGRNCEPVKRRYWGTFAFWLPAPRPFIRCAGETKVAGAFKHELEALRAGAIIEHVQEFEFEKEPTIPELARRLMPVWEGLAADSLKFPFNSVPLDTTTRPSFAFADVTKPKVLIAETPRGG